MRKPREKTKRRGESASGPSWSAGGGPRRSNGRVADASRPSRYARWRAASLALVYVLIAAHIVHWRLRGRTLAPLELNEVVYTLELGIVTAGFLFMVTAVAATAVVGRFFCSWGCHILALQDLCAWLLGKLGLRPKAVRSRLLMAAPFALAFYMFGWPAVERLVSGAAQPDWRMATDAEGWASFVTQNFWRNLPGPGITLLTFAVCGFLIVYVLGSRSFCTYGCPYGAIFRAADKIAPGRIRLVKSCDNCGRCTAACTSHVRVGEELQRFGMVVDSACLKDLDCVAACPEQAVRFGFGRPAVLAPVRQDTPVRRRYDFTAVEEVLLAAVMLGSVLIFRGLYDRIPLLLSLALGAIGAYTCVVALRLVRRPAARFNRWVLKSEGRVHLAGWLVLLMWAPAFATGLHSALIRYHHWMGLRQFAALRATAQAADPSSSAPSGEAIAPPLHHLQFVNRWGLTATPSIFGPLARLHAAQASLDLAEGDGAAAMSHLRESVRLDPGAGAVHLRLGTLLIENRRMGAGLAHLRTAVRLAPQSSEAHYNLGVALAMTGAIQEARPEIVEACRLNPDDPQITEFLAYLSALKTDTAPAAPAGTDSPVP